MSSTWRNKAAMSRSSSTIRANGFSIVCSRAASALLRAPPRYAAMTVKTLPIPLYINRARFASPNLPSLARRIPRFSRQLPQLALKPPDARAPGARTSPARSGRTRNVPLPGWQRDALNSVTIRAGLIHGPAQRLQHVPFVVGLALLIPGQLSSDLDIAQDLFNAFVAAAAGYQPHVRSYRVQQPLMPDEFAQLALYALGDARRCGMVGQVFDQSQEQARASKRDSVSVGLRLFFKRAPISRRNVSSSSGCMLFWIEAEWGPGRRISCQSG